MISAVYKFDDAHCTFFHVDRIWSIIISLGSMGCGPSVVASSAAHDRTGVHDPSKRGVPSQGGEATEREEGGASSTLAPAGQATPPRNATPQTTSRHHQAEELTAAPVTRTEVLTAALPLLREANTSEKPTLVLKPGSRSHDFVSALPHLFA